MPPSPTDSEHAANPSRLIKEPRDGSREALDNLLERHRPDLLKVANAQLADLQSTAGGSDLVQQTFLEARQSAHQFEGATEAELTAWLRRTLDRNAADFRRKFRDSNERQVGQETPPDVAGSEVDPFGGLTSREPPPGSRAPTPEQIEAVDLALSRLPAADRQLVELHNRQHLTFAEIALKVDRSPEAVRKLWTRAIRNLQRELGLS